MKTCATCKEEKTESEFNRKKSSRDGLQHTCRKCSQLTSKQYYKDNRSKHIKQIGERRKRNIQRNREFIWSWLTSHPCVDCGESDPIVLEFDHQHNKEKAISDAVRHAWSLKKLKEEINKCVVRCANCHRRKTAKDFGWNKALVAQPGIERLPAKEKVGGSNPLRGARPQLALLL